MIGYRSWIILAEQLRRLTQIEEEEKRRRAAYGRPQLVASLSLPEQIPNQRQRRDQRHAHDGAATDAFHS